MVELSFVCGAFKFKGKRVQVRSNAHATHKLKQAYFADTNWLTPFITVSHCSPERKITNSSGIITHFIIMDYCTVVGVNSSEDERSPRPGNARDILAHIKSERDPIMAGVD